jgi:hypothetical protein
MPNGYGRMGRWPGCWDAGLLAQVTEEGIEKGKWCFGDSNENANKNLRNLKN